MTFTSSPARRSTSARPCSWGESFSKNSNLPGGKKTKTSWATGSKCSRPGARLSDLRAMLEYREVTKLKNTYVDVLPSLADAKDACTPIFNQTSTATGRLSSTNPNLQNIPVRSELGRRVRKAFVAPAGRVAAGRGLQSDRVAVDGASFGRRGDACRRLRKVRTFTTSRRARSSRCPKGHGRSQSAPHGQSGQLRFALRHVEFGLLATSGDSRAEARAMTDAYFARFPGVRAWIDGESRRRPRARLCQTLLGRRRYMPDLRARNFALRAAAEREATNAPLQGSAADLDEARDGQGRCGAA